MLKSMTGFGRYELVKEEFKLTAELKSVNHRYLDLSVRLPKKLGFLEASVRTLLKQHMLRGKVDVYISYEDYKENKVRVRYNSELAGEYYRNLLRMCEEFSIENDVKVTKLARFPEVLELLELETDETELWSLLEGVLLAALERFKAARQEEGSRLQEDLLQKLDKMKEYVDFVEQRSPQLVEEYRRKIAAKVAELLGDTKLDQAILATELTIYADKICVDEETVRLKSHILNMRKVLEEEEGIGRKLDFIAQEMNREANTILSKANDLDLTNAAINLKTDIEKIREQIQNIE